MEVWSATCTHFLVDEVGQLQDVLCIYTSKVIGLIVNLYSDGGAAVVCEAKLDSLKKHFYWMIIVPWPFRSSRFVSFSQIFQPLAAFKYCFNSPLAAQSPQFHTPELQ